MILYKHFDTNDRGHLTVGGLDTVELAKNTALRSIFLTKLAYANNAGHI